MGGFRRLAGRVAIAGLTTVVATGGVVYGATVFTDDIVWPAHSVSSAPRARVADIKIATPNLVDDTCTGVSYSDDANSIPPISYTDLTSETIVGQTVCIANKGTRTITTTLQATDLVSQETGCTGDEPIVDPTCEVGDPGELEKALEMKVSIFDPTCTVPAKAADSIDLEDWAIAPHNLIQMDKGTMNCVIVQVGQIDALEVTPPNEDVMQSAQSDLVQWSLRFGSSSL
jgi:hypothetical protein